MKKKKNLKILNFVLVAILAMSVVLATGCKKNDAGNTATNVQLYYWKSGWGLDWIEAVIDGYNKAQDQYTVTLDYDENASTILSSLDLEDDNNYDLYFCMLQNMQKKDQFVKMDSVLASKAFGEEKTVGEKYYPYLLNGVANKDGSHSFLTYGNSWCGIVYNTEIIDGVKYQVPRTTYELEVLTTDLKNAGYDPWIFFNAGSGGGYWTYLVNGWQAQYDGLDYYNNTFMQLDAPTEDAQKAMLTTKDGRYEALKVCESIITPNTVHAEVTNTNFTKVQTLYLHGNGVMMPNGGWLLNESSGTASVAMMKLPVISSIVEKLEDSDMDDETLATIVGEVDEGKTSSALCSQNDFDRIKEARSVLYNNGAEQYVFIPEYSNAIEGAQDFLTYLYSDAGILAYMENTGAPAAAKLTDTSKFDTSTLDVWKKAQFTLADECYAITGLIAKADVFANTGLDGFMGVEYPNAFSTNNPNQRQNVDQVWDSLVKKVNSNWEDWNA